MTKHCQMAIKYTKWPLNTYYQRPGTDVMIFKIFSAKNLAKILAFFAQTTASVCKNCDHNIGF
jgi:hypothetical protein